MKEIVDRLEYKITLWRNIERHTIPFQIKNMNSDIASHISFGYNLVRFGIDEIIEKATEKERKYAVLQNKEFEAKSYYDEINKEMKIEIPLEIHKILGVQFKIFVDVAGREKLTEIENFLQENEQFDDIRISDGLGKNRIYFLLKYLSNTKTIEGIRNNFIYPK